MDFFSWHRYSGDPADYAPRARAIRRLLDEYGFTTTESHLNEWNYLPNEDWRPMMKEGQGAVRERWSVEMRGPKGAAFAAWALISLQDAPVDMANYYTAEVQMFGMFNFNGVPQKTFHAFRTFRALLDTPRRVRTPVCEAGKIAVCAGIDPEAKRAGVLLSNFDTAGDLPKLSLRQLPWKTATRFELYLVDAAHDDELVRSGSVQGERPLVLPELTPASVVLLKLSPLPSSH